jgi:hypothetical protein
VDEHHVHVDASKNNDGTIVKVPRGTDLFRNSIATPSLIASIINGKYNYARSIVLFDWQPSRKADHPRNFLKNFSGTVITDGYQVYHKLGRDLKFIDELLPWAPRVQETCPSRFKKS